MANPGGAPLDQPRASVIFAKNTVFWSVFPYQPRHSGFYKRYFPIAASYKRAYLCMNFWDHFRIFFQISLVLYRFRIKIRQISCFWDFPEIGQKRPKTHKFPIFIHFLLFSKKAPILDHFSSLFLLIF